MHNKNKIYLQNMLDSIIDIENFVVDYTEESFIEDRKTFSACIRMLEIIGEATKRISTDLKGNNPQIEWKKVSGLRDVLIHDYEGVDLGALWQSIQVNLPILKNQIQNIIKNL